MVTWYQLVRIVLVVLIIGVPIGIIKLKKFRFIYRKKAISIVIISIILSVIFAIYPWENLIGFRSAESLCKYYQNISAESVYEKSECGIVFAKENIVVCSKKGERWVIPSFYYFRQHVSIYDGTAIYVFKLDQRTVIYTTGILQREITDSLGNVFAERVSLADSTNDTYWVYYYSIIDSSLPDNYYLRQHRVIWNKAKPQSGFSTKAHAYVDIFGAQAH